MKAYQIGKEVPVTRYQFGGHAGFSTVYQWNSPKLFDLYNATEIINGSSRDGHYRELTQLCLQKNMYKSSPHKFTFPHILYNYNQSERRSEAETYKTSQQS